MAMWSMPVLLLQIKMLNPSLLVSTRKEKLMDSRYKLNFLLYLVFALYTANDKEIKKI